MILVIDLFFRLDKQEEIYALVAAVIQSKFYAEIFDCHAFFTFS